MVDLSFYRTSGAGISGTDFRKARRNVGKGADWGIGCRSETRHICSERVGMARLDLNPRAATALVVCVVLLLGGTLELVSAQTRPSDVSALNSLNAKWTYPSGQLNWGKGDPCSTPWTGLTCDSANYTVTNMTLTIMNISGTIDPAIGDLTGLVGIELSQNTGLTGPIPPSIGNLGALRSLSIQWCLLNGELPSTFGQLNHLAFLGLNGNNLSGPIPGELGNTSLTWMDVSINKLNGSLPISTNASTLGLNNITTIVHFHLNNNSFSGSVPAELFTMPHVQHLMLDHNHLTGPLPNITTTFSNSLTVIRVDMNGGLNGPIPEKFTTVPNLYELNLKGNQFSGPVPDFSAMAGTLNFLDIGQNNFNKLGFPSWASKLDQCMTINLENMGITGAIDSAVFKLVNLQTIDLSNNALSGDIPFSGSTGPWLQTIDLENNNITGFNGQPTGDNASTNLTIVLTGNPICNNTFFTLPGSSCPSNAQLQQFVHPNTQSACFGSAFTQICNDDGKYQNPYTCACSYPLVATLLLTAPPFSNLNQAAEPLESDLAQKLNIYPNQTYIFDMAATSDARVDVTLWVFPNEGDFLSSDITNNITNSLRHHAFFLKDGPYLLVTFLTVAVLSSSSSLSSGAVIGIAVGAVLGFLIIAASIILALFFKRRADKAKSNNPFASWGGGSTEFGEAPKLKGARWFSLAELKAYTHNWSDENLLGIGGYGKVYRGELPEGDLVAIKRATEGSMQGANEFKNEIELLSRVHHRNLVGLVGFCYEGGEQALIYEFLSNGTLTDHLMAAEVPLSWEKRCDIALQSAIGINYLHDHASPPIIHRDIKSANILLNDKMVAKVADFGLSKLAPDEGEKAVYSVNVKGTLGYLDPEYYMSQNLTDKSDVYSFGVVLLELLTARPPIDQGRFVVREFRTALDRSGIAAIRPLMDPTLDNLSDEELEPYLKIALACVEEDGASRPNTAELVIQLQALDVFAKKKSSSMNVRSMDVDSNGGPKKVKFAEDFQSEESDQAELLSGDMPPGVTYPYQQAPDSFRYSGAYGVSPKVQPK